MKSDEKLLEELLAATAYNYRHVIEENEGCFEQTEHAFTEYMRGLARSKSIHWVDIAPRIGFSSAHLYKLISREKITRQRDLILRIGFGMGLELEEMQKALTLYGFSPLYVRRKRDALLMKAFWERRKDIDDVNAFLLQNGEEALYLTARGKRGTDD